jgi:hypothetical protein
MSDQRTLYQQWRDGDLTDMEAFRRMLDDYGEIEEVYGYAKSSREAIRIQMSDIVAHMGDRATCGVYEAIITAPGTTSTYDAKGLDDLVLELAAQGNPIARRIAAHRKQTSRAGSLRITRKK